MHQSGHSGGRGDGETGRATHLHGVSGRGLVAAGVGGGVRSVRCPGGEGQCTCSREAVD